MKLRDITKRVPVKKAQGTLYPGRHPIGSLIIQFHGEKVDAVGILVRSDKSGFSIRWNDRDHLYHFPFDHVFIDNKTYTHELIEP